MNDTVRPRRPLAAILLIAGAGLWAFGGLVPDGGIGTALVESGYSAPIGYLSADLGFAFDAFTLQTVLFWLGAVALIAGSLLVVAPLRQRLIGLLVAVVGYTLFALVGAVLAELLGFRIAFLIWGLLALGAVVVGALLALGAPARSLAWLPLLLAPALLALLAPSLAVLVVAEALALVVAALIVLLGQLASHGETARRAQREAVAAQRAAGLEQAQLAARAEEIRRWEDAYALAHDGERPPAGFAPPIAMPSAAGRTNTLAILALVFAIIGSIVGLILGYVARSQIRRTGEAGAGLALAAIVIGWVEVGITVALLVFYVVVIALAIHR